MFDFLRQENGDGRREGDDSDVLRGCRSGVMPMTRGCGFAACAAATFSRNFEQPQLTARCFSGAAPRLGEVFAITVAGGICISCAYRRVAGTIEHTVVAFEGVRWKKGGWILAHMSTGIRARGLFGRAAATHDGGALVLNI